MRAKLLEGKPVADKIKASLAAKLLRLKTEHGKTPKLVAVQIGENASSAVYVKAQKKVAETIGIEYVLKVLPGEMPQDECEKVIQSLNDDHSTTAVILQLPVPRGIDAKMLVNTISPSKDAEGMHPQNLGKIVLGRCTIGPCTAMAVMELLEDAGLDLYGKEAVIVGHSEIVGKPLSLMLVNKFATTTICHIATSEKGMLIPHVRRAEILIVAVGKANIIKGEWVKDGAVVVDVGINRVGDKIVGDVEFDAAAERAAHITPVPGGVGPLTTTILMRNVLELSKAK